jgi:hypothetical protein
MQLRARSQLQRVSVAEGEHAMSRLEELAIKYKCDKYYNHSYVPFYEALFSQIEVRSLLEIGIGYEDLMKPFVPEYVHGASLLMWEEYFPHARIFSCDIREDTLINRGRIQSIYCDQTDVFQLSNLAMWLKIVSRWPHSSNTDIVIDDGSHEVESQLLTAKVLLPLLRPAIYVIEDCREPQLVADKLYDNLRVPVLQFRFDKRPDDNLVVITAPGLEVEL